MFPPVVLDMEEAEERIAYSDAQLDKKSKVAPSHDELPRQEQRRDFSAIVYQDDVRKEELKTGWSQRSKVTNRDTTSHKKGKSDRKEKQFVAAASIQNSIRIPLQPVDMNITKKTIESNKKDTKWPDYERIMNSRNETKKADLLAVNLLHLRQVLHETAGKNLMDTYPQLYEVLKITSLASPTVKSIRNNIRYKLKNLYSIYPHLAFYGRKEDMCLERLQAVPDILLNIESEVLRRQFLSTPPARKGRRAGQK